MFYVYKNTMNDSTIIGKFTNKDNALAYMESKALNNFNPDVTGFSVRDFELNSVISEYEV